MASYIVTKADGTKVKRTNVKGGGFKDQPVTSSKKKSSKKSSSSSRNNDFDIQIGIRDAKTGKVIQKAKVTDNRKTKNLGSKQKASTKGFENEVTIRNTKTGVSTTVKTDSGTGKIISKKQAQFSPTRPVTQGTLEAPERNFLQRIREKSTALKNPRGESGFVRGLKGVGAVVIDAPTSFVNSLKTGATALLGNPTSRALIQNAVSNFSLSAIGSSLGRAVQSSDPYVRTQGIVSIGSLFVPIKVPLKSSVRIIDSKAPKFETKINAKTGNTITKINREGELSSGGKIKIDNLLRSSGKTGDIKVVSKLDIDGKTRIEKTTLKNEGGFYTDLKTGEKISKTNVIPSNINYKITKIQTTINPKRAISADDKITIVGKGIATSRTTRGNIRDGKRREVTTTRTSVIDAGLGGKRLRPVDVKAFKQAFRVSATKSRVKNTKNISDEKIKRFLDIVRYDKEIINGLDRRMRMARALGLRKTSPIITNLVKYVKGEIKLTTGKGKIKAEGEIPGYYKEPMKIRRNALFRDKRGSVLEFNKKRYVIPKGEKIPKKDVDGVFTIPRDITIPKLKTHLKNLKKLRVRGIIPAKGFKQYQSRVKDFIESNKKTNIPTRKQTPERVTDRDQKRVPTQKKLPATKKSAKNKNKSTRKPLKPSIKSTVPRIRLKTPVRARLPLLLEFKLDINRVPNNAVAKYVGFYRERVNPLRPYNKRTNPIVTKKVSKTTTKNRMINFVAGKADNKAIRSIQVGVAEVTKKKLKDVKLDKVLSKFSRRKGQNPKVLQLVEGSKHAMDSPGEKREFKTLRKIAKAKPKRAKSTKKKKAKVSVKKAKKVSKKPSKKKTTTKKKKKR